MLGTVQLMVYITFTFLFRFIFFLSILYFLFLLLNPKIIIKNTKPTHTHKTPQNRSARTEYDSKFIDLYLLIFHYHTHQNQSYITHTENVISSKLFSDANHNFKIIKSFFFLIQSIVHFKIIEKQKKIIIKTTMKREKHTKICLL